MLCLLLFVWVGCPNPLLCVCVFLVPRYNSPLPTFSTWLRQRALDAVGSENGVFFQFILLLMLMC